MSRDGSLGALLLLGQLGLNLMGELVQVLVHTLHAEPLGVEKTAVLRRRESRVHFHIYFQAKHLICLLTFILRWKDYLFVELD